MKAKIHMPDGNKKTGIRRTRRAYGSNVKDQWCFEGKSVKRDKKKNSDYYENCEKVSIRFVGRGHPFHNSAMRGLRGCTVKKERDFAKQDGSDWGGGVRRVKRPMEIRTVFVAPLTIFTCYRMIVCSRYIGDFEDRWKTKPGRGSKREERSKFRAKLVSRLYELYVDLHVVCKDHF